MLDISVAGAPSLNVEINRSTRLLLGRIESVEAKRFACCDSESVVCSG